jgi:glycosyltransferase involved in cell wall biosynthesis
VSVLDPRYGNEIADPVASRVPNFSVIVGGKAPNYDIDVVIPALNEESRILPTIEAVGLELSDRPERVRVIVVDNGSVDATAAMVDAAYPFRLSVEVIGCRQRGKGAAVRAGVLHADAPVIAYCDADLSTPASAIAVGADLVRSGSDIVVGSRRCAGAAILQAQAPARRIGSLAFRSLARPLAGPVSDTQCGFKCFRGPVARDLFARSVIPGFAFDLEILALARAGGYRVTEMPVQWSDTSGSSFRLVADGLRSVRELARLRRSFRAQVIDLRDRP